MSQRATFSGAESGIGILVLSSFYVFGVLGVVGVGILIVTGQAHFDLGELGLYTAFVVAVGWWGMMIMREVRSVRVVVIEDDGTWRLKGPLGFSRGKIAAGEPRRVIDRKQETWLFGIPRRITITWAVIESGSRSWRTTGGIPSSQRKATDLLQSWVAAHRS